MLRYVHAQLLFCFTSQSRMLVVDELSARDKQGTLPFCDFIEALCRLADVAYSGSFLREKGTLSNAFTPFVTDLFKGLSRKHNGRLKVRMPGSAEDGRLALDIDAFLASRLAAANAPAQAMQ
jgi:hypothetical protein